MTPAARIAAAIEILDRVGVGRGADRVLARWGRDNRYAGSGDRAALADLVYGALRRRRSAAWRMGAGDEASGRTLMLGRLAQGHDLPAIEALFSGARHAPAPLDDEDRARLAVPPPPAPDAVRLDIPDWLAPELRRALGADFVPALEAMTERAPADLRVNALKSDIQTARAALARDGVGAEPGPLAPLCLRVTAGARRLRNAAALRDGLVEVQDAASQAIALLANARPGARVLDYCAGGGGKTLAMAADMQGRGELLAHDADPSRMAGLPARARRAGARVTLLDAAGVAALAGRCDLTLVDAPCSGSGAWRRNPDAKWAFTREELDRMTALQSRILAAAARCVAPGGRLVYATCSLLRAENRDVVDGFLARGDCVLEAERRLTPLDGGDGFYGAVIRLSPR